MLKQPSNEPTLVERIRKEIEEQEDFETAQSKNVMKHFFEPPYLDKMKPSTPFYSYLNVKVRQSRIN